MQTDRTLLELYKILLKEFNSGDYHFICRTIQITKQLSSEEKNRLKEHFLTQYPTETLYPEIYNNSSFNRDYDDKKEDRQNKWFFMRNPDNSEFSINQHKIVFNLRIRLLKLIIQSIEKELSRIAKKQKSLETYSDKIELDKFYTKESIAIELIKHINLSKYDVVIEPSAGNGSFSRNLKHPNVMAFDLKPEAEGIVEMDWFTYKNESKGDILIIGNPPFGKRNDLSKKFIQHSLSFAKTIAFVLPNVFHKPTLQSIFPKGWRLAEVVEIEDNAFVIDNEEYHVPCSFFIFDKSEGKNLMFDREKYQTCEFFKWAEKDDADFYIMGAGLKLKSVEEVEENNRGYYIKSKTTKQEIVNALTKAKSKGHSSANGGVSWMIKEEIIKAIIE